MSWVVAVVGLGVLLVALAIQARARGRAEGEARFRRLADSAPVMIWTADASGARDFFNAAWLGFTGHTLEIERASWSDGIHADDRSRYLETLSAARAEHGAYEVEYRLRCADGQFHWILETGTWRMAGDGVDGVVASAIDVTAQRYEKQVRIRLSSFVEQSGEAMVLTERDGRIIYVNPAFERATQYAAAEVIGQTPRILRSGQHDRRFYESMWETIVAGGVWSGEVTNRRKDGTLYTEQQTILPIRDGDGRIANFLAIGQDTTTRRGLEAQLRQAMKMEAVGRLAGGIAHDFNNLLTVILGYTDVDDGTPIEAAAVQAVRGAAVRAAALTQQLLAFSRQQVLAPRILDINQVVRGFAAIVGRLVGEDIEVVVAADAKLHTVKADPHQLEQVIMNLVVNARDAMPHGGRLVIETANVTLDREYALSHVAIPAGDYVMVAVTDTGTGMDNATLSRIFEPFFTTKGAGGGTGLGLATVYGVVKQSGGHVLVYSEVGKGTTFKIYLPRSVEEVEMVEAPLATTNATGAETVLLVEDEDGVRHLLRTVLRRHGYTVIEARHGAEALTFSDQYSGRIDLLMTDLVMPQMAGTELAARFAERRPDTRVLFMSGYTEHAVLGELGAAAAFIQKPFTPSTIARKVRDVLDGATN